METSELQVEVELIPTVELINGWPKKARWPRFFKRWPSKERARCYKTLLMWTCEKYPGSKDWRNFKKCVNQRYLRHFFVRGYNLLKYTNTIELDIMAKKISDFLENPGLYIH